MLDTITRNWWILLLRGLVAIIFGVLAFTWPGITLASLVLVYGIYALADGITAIAVGTVGGFDGKPWWQMILAGILAVAAGILTFVWPGITAVALLAIIASCAILRGVAQVVAAVRLRTVIANEWLLILSGICSVLFGLVLISRPLAGALAVVWIIGTYALFIGVVKLALSFRLHSLGAAVQRGAAPLTAARN